ncbi:MAG: flagellar motor switch protein FliY [Helicobacteraceae bacterium]|jgi:flagellar motor switch protein FliN/FliY|nr:flagellar motor switch protein FliY [Helicobacteraceae bacterium]
MTFIELLQKEMIATVNGLLGSAPDISFKDEQNLNANSNVVPPAVVIDVSFSGAASGGGLIVLMPQLATTLSDMMLGGTGTPKDKVESDDLDAAKEIVSQIVGALSSSLEAQNELPKLSIKIEKARFVDADSAIELGAFARMFTFNFNIASIESVIMFAVGSAIVAALDKKNEPKSAPLGNAAAEGGAHEHHAHPLTADELANIGLLMDVRLTVRVRIGKKQMLLRDVINMDIGSIVELDQLANEPLDILVDNKKIAEGEVVIVDGNFGVQITSISTKRERLEQLKN